MVSGKYVAFMALGLLALAPPSVQADTLAINTAGALPLTTAPGQSVTTPNGAGFHALTFNWYNENLQPTAAGTLFLLDQEYLGKAGDLNRSTPGFVGASQSIAGGEYVFDSDIILQGGTQYFFYSNQILTFIGDGNRYFGGILYLPINNDIFNNFIAVPRQDADFRLSGSPIPAVVPETSTFAFLASSTLTGIAFLCRRKQLHKAT